MTPLLGALAAALFLQPVLAEDGPLRLVAVGTGDETIDWTLDGRLVATTRDGEAATVDASAGRHELWATSRADGEWRALARPAGAAPGEGGAVAVPAWSAHHAAEPDGTMPAWTWPAASAAAAGLILVRPSRLGRTGARVRSLLQARGRRRST